MSINLCTDQLALLVAPDRVLSVSYMSRQPWRAPLADLARGKPANSGQAEELFLHNPDLVLAGSFNSPATLALLDRLGVPVARFAPATSLKDVGLQLRQMGEVLGEAERGDALARDFEEKLAALRRSGSTRAALYAANGYSEGDRTLAGEILAAAGYANIAGELGRPDGGFLGLEELVLAGPDLVVTSRSRGYSRAESVLDHPALAAIGRRASTDRDWICALPHVLRAIETLASGAVR